MVSPNYGCTRVCTSRNGGSMAVDFKVKSVQDATCILHVNQEAEEVAALYGDHCK